VANPFKWEHFVYGMAGLAIGMLTGYLVGILAFSLLASSAAYNANATQASFFIFRFSSVPMQITILGMVLGFIFGIVYSHEKYEKEEKESKAIQPQQVIVVPQGQVPQQVVVPQQPQQK
jgi:uncharacterized integral membrane protein